MKRLVILILITLFIGGAGLVGYVYWKTREAPHITSSGGRSFSILLPVKDTHFLQRDPRWAAEKLGQTTESIGAVGCAICSVATAANALGEETNPKNFNQALTAAKGYTPQRWLVWASVSQVFEKRIEVTVISSPSHETMDSALERGEYPVIKFFLPMGIPHWVVAVGKNGQEYLVHDPLQPTPQAVPLSQLTSRIHSVRLVKKSS